MLAITEILNYVEVVCLPEWQRYGEQAIDHWLLHYSWCSPEDSYVLVDINCFNFLGFTYLLVPTVDLVGTEASTLSTHMSNGDISGKKKDTIYSEAVTLKTGI